MSDHAGSEEIEVYVCWEWGTKGPNGRRRNKDPLLMRVYAHTERELLGFKDHPMRAEILALADLVGRDVETENMGFSDDGRPRFSLNFKVPVEWFDGCEWGK